MKSLFGYLFLGGLVLIVIDALRYLLGMETKGILFAAGFSLCLLVAAVGAFTEKQKPQASEIVTVLLAATFFGWLAIKALAR